MATEPTTPFSTEQLAWPQAAFGLASTTQRLKLGAERHQQPPLPHRDGIQTTATTSGKSQKNSNCCKLGTHEDLEPPPTRTPSIQHRSDENQLSIMIITYYIIMSYNYNPTFIWYGPHSSPSSIKR